MALYNLSLSGGLRFRRKDVEEHAVLDGKTSSGSVCREFCSNAFCIAENLTVAIERMLEPKVHSYSYDGQGEPETQS